MVGWVGFEQGLHDLLRMFKKYPEVWEEVRR